MILTLRQLQGMKNKRLSISELESLLETAKFTLFSIKELKLRLKQGYL